MILVVDDEPMIRLILVELLQDSGYEVLEAKNCEEARARFGDDVEAVLLDIRLKQENGMDLLPWFKERRPQTCVVMMTGDGRGEERRARDLGASGFIDKPFDMDAVVRMVERLVPRAA